MGIESRAQHLSEMMGYLLQMAKGKPDTLRWREIFATSNEAPVKIGDQIYPESVINNLLEAHRLGLIPSHIEDTAKKGVDIILEEYKDKL